MGPNYVVNLLLGIHMYLSGIWEGLVFKNNTKKACVLTRFVCVLKMYYSLLRSKCEHNWEGIWSCKEEYKFLTPHKFCIFNLDLNLKMISCEIYNCLQEDQIYRHVPIIQILQGVESAHNKVTDFTSNWRVFFPVHPPFMKVDDYITLYVGRTSYII